MRRVALLATLLFAAACAKSPAAPADSPERFLVTAYATPESLRAGTTTNVIVGITNITGKPQSFESNFCGPAYHVFNPAGARISASSGCFTYSATKTLAPGEQIVYSSPWTATLFTDSVTPPLEPGTYTLRGALDGADVHSDPFEIQIIP